MRKYSKQEIYKKFKNSAFPKEKIATEALDYKDYLFENEQNKQFIDESMLFGSANKNNKNNLSESFYDPNDTMYGGEFNYNYNKNLKDKNTIWRKNISKNDANNNAQDFYSNKINNNNYESEYNRNTAKTKNNNFAISNSNNNYKGNKIRNENKHAVKNAGLDISSCSFSLVYEAKADKIPRNQKYTEVKQNDLSHSENEGIIATETPTQKQPQQQNKNPKTLKKKAIQVKIDKLRQEEFVQEEENKAAINNKNPKQQAFINNNTKLIFNEKLKHEISKAQILEEKALAEENDLAEMNTKSYLNVEANEVENVNLANFSPNNNFCEDILYAQKNSNLNNNNSNINNNIAFTGFLNFKKIYEINKALKYPEVKPLWYINHPEANSSFGPLSTKQLEVMYSNKQINEATKIRFIDLFKFKNKANFEFVVMKELESPCFLIDVEMNTLYKSLSEELSSLKVIGVKSLLKTNIALNMKNNNGNFVSSNIPIKSSNNIINNKNINNNNNLNKPFIAAEANTISVNTFEEKNYKNKVIVNIKKENKKPIKKIKEAEPLDLPIYDKSLFEIKSNHNNNNNNNNILNKQPNIKEEEEINEENTTNYHINEIHNLINQQLKNVFDDEEDIPNFIEKNFKKNLNTEIHNMDQEKETLESNNNNNQAAFGTVKKTNKKKGKAQRVNIALKTGFYTLTEQEKVYDPIFIVGDHE